MTASARPGSLVLYKSAPARVVSITDKIEIVPADGRLRRVRDKDIVVLHPGPVGDLNALGSPSGEIEAAHELLGDETMSLAELAELIYGEFRPDTAWATWQLIDDGLWFAGSVERVTARPAVEVAELRAERERKALEKAAWEGFLERARARRPLTDAEDRRYTVEVEAVALGRSESSRVLKALDLAQTPETAHAFLLEAGVWQPRRNPYPERFGLPVDDADGTVGELPDESRSDLTGTPAYAIDDADNTDPDDAIALDGDRCWVHVADVAALVAPESELDIAARERASNQYLPERTVHMLPRAITERLGVGLAAESPALSIGFVLDADGAPGDVQIETARVRVARMSYEQAETRLDADLAPLWAIAERLQQRRLAAGAVRVRLPEARVRVLPDGAIDIRELPPLRARDLVTEWMLAAGEAVAIWLEERSIAAPFVTQGPPDERVPRPGDAMSGQYAFRRAFQRAVIRTGAAPHAGLGITRYVRATSPLRRYADLVVHQQLRAALAGATPLDHEAMLERIAAMDNLAGAIARSERFSNLHWKLVWLGEQQGWKGEAVVVELGERGRGTVIVPSLALETKVRLPDGARLDDRIELSLDRVDLPAQIAYFHTKR